MEINRFEDVLGVVPTADVVEGRMVVLTSHSHTYDFGSNEDLAGAKVPATAEEAKRAKYIITWKVDNRPTPIFMPTPSYDWALREGWDQTDNAPFDTTVHLTYPGNKEGLTIPSGTPSLAFTEGTFTVPSGAYISDANIVVPGAALIVADTATDGAGNAGKLKYTASFAAGVIGVVERYDSATGRLTFRIE